MNRKLLSILIVFFIAINVFGQNEFNCTLYGKVYDKDSKTPVIGAIVVVKSKEQTETIETDINGEFKISKLKPGRINVVCMLLSYETATLNEVLLSSGKIKPVRTMILQQLAPIHFQLKKQSDMLLH